MLATRQHVTTPEMQEGAGVVGNLVGIRVGMLRDGAMVGCAVVGVLEEAEGAREGAVEGVREGDVEGVREGEVEGGAGAGSVGVGEVATIEVGTGVRLRVNERMSMRIMGARMPAQDFNETVPRAMEVVSGVGSQNKEIICGEKVSQIGRGGHTLLDSAQPI